MLREKGVHRVAAAPELEGALLETRLQPTQEKPLWRACSGQAALALLAKRGLRPEQTWLCLKTPRVDRDVLRCARLLARRVRYLTVRAPVGGEALAEELYEEYGIALQQSVPPEYSQLCLCLAGDPAEEGIIPLDGRADGGLAGLGAGMGQGTEARWAGGYPVWGASAAKWAAPAGRDPGGRSKNHA